MKNSPPQPDQLLEALLFAHGEPISIKRLAKSAGLTKEAVEKGLEMLDERLAKSSGLRLLRREQEIQLVAAKEHAQYIERMFKNQHKEDLTRASLEVLSIVGYAGPLTREEIESIRGVNSSYILRRLCMRGLIEKEIQDTAAHYRVSLATLRHLGVTEEKELPQWESIQERITSAKAALHNEDA